MHACITHHHQMPSETKQWMDAEHQNQSMQCKAKRRKAEKAGEEEGGYLCPGCQLKIFSNGLPIIRQ
jgi:hypothetical protein